jgi:XrtJ-associated TM-motif-TM protein
MHGVLPSPDTGPVVQEEPPENPAKISMRRCKMNKTRFVILSTLALLACAASLQAQSGCTDSPEAPTALLMLVGTAGMFYGSSVLRKVLGRGGKR